MHVKIPSERNNLGKVIEILLLCSCCKVEKLPSARNQLFVIRTRFSLRKQQDFLGEY